MHCAAQTRVLAFDDPVRHGVLVGGRRERRDAWLATGDCFNTGNGRGLNPTGSPTPGFYVDYTTGGSFRDFPKAADAALKLDWDVVIPGHGPLANRAGFVKWRAAVDATSNRLSSMVREGKSKTDVEEMLVGEFGWERTGAPFRSIEGLLAELRR